MSAGARLALFAVGLAVVSGGAAVAGATIDPDRGEATDGAQMSDSNGHSGGAGDGAEGADAIRGLSVADRGLRLVLDDTELSQNRSERVRFRVVDDRDRTVRAFDVENERRMHLIVARRDMSGFQHVHPKQADDGSWSIDLRLRDAGSYRLFADFGRDGELYTLASDVRVDGDADLRPLPVPDPTAVTDGGYEVRLENGSARAGKESELRFEVSKDGVPVETEPYLGAGGHLVVLREGDLAYLHVHPTEGRSDGSGPREGGVGFAATFPTEGRYRLFMQFKHEGRVRTAAFTQEVS